MPRPRPSNVVWTAMALLWACHAPNGATAAPPDSEARSPSVDAGVAPPPTAPGSSPAAPVGPPLVERDCDTDADCAVAQIEVTGDAVCCWACGTTPGSKRWYAELQRFCGPRPAWTNPKCGALACPAGPSVAICREHRCEATWMGADGGPTHVTDERRCVPAWVCNAWSGCALVAGNTQNGTFVERHEHVDRGEPATMLHVCRGDAGCFDAASLAAPSSVCASATIPGAPPGYACRTLPADHDAPVGRCVVAPTR